MTKTHRISTGSPFEKKLAYSRAVVKGDWCFVAGTTGYDYTAMIMPEDVLDQARNALETIETTLNQAGFAMRDVVRARYIVTEPTLYGDIAPALQEAFDAYPPAGTMIVAGLIDPAMKVEIDVTALRD